MFRLELALALLAIAPPLRAQAPKAAGTEPAVRRIAFGSCLGQDLPLPVFDHLLAAKPDVFVMLGDNVYADTKDPAALRAAYAKLQAQPLFARLRKAARLLATWDDHDYGTNDAGGDFPAKAASQQVFLDFLGVPPDSPRRQREGVYHAEVLGPPGRRVQVILLDTRYHRSPLRWEDDPKDFEEGGRYVPNPDPTATLLGAAQWTWLEEQLRVPAQVRIVASSIQVVNEDYTGEKWANFPLERKKLFELVWASRVTGLLFISGDRHLAELSMMDGDVGFPVYDLTSSSFNWSERHWRPVESSRHRMGIVPQGDNFGLVEIDWERKDPLIRLKVIDDDGDLRLHEKIELSTLRDGTVPWWLELKKTREKKDP